MGPLFVVVGDEFLNQISQVLLPENDEVIEAPIWPLPCAQPAEVVATSELSDFAKSAWGRHTSEVIDFAKSAWGRHAYADSTSSEGRNVLRQNSSPKR